MVLTRRAALGLLLLCACVQRAPVLKVQEPTAVSVAFVRDGEHQGGVFAVPDALKRQIASELGKRNLDVREIAFEQYEKAFAQTRDSRRRLEKLRQLAKDAPYVLLVETTASFFSQISGRWRWQVQAKLSAARRDGGDAVDDAFNLPTIVDFEHEKEDAVLSAASALLAERAGALMDDFLGAEARSPQSSRPPDDFDAIYFVLVDRFANGDPSNDGKTDPADPAAFHGGDLEGLIDRLDWLEQLGVRTVWLSPIFAMRTEKFFGHGAFHGYWVEDLTRIEPRFGDEATLKRLSEELARRDMRLLLDVVLNHVGPDAPLVKEKPEWFHRKGPLEDWNDPEQLTTHDVHGLPDLAVERDDVQRHLLGASMKWLRLARPHGFRLDAVKHVPLSFWARYNDEIRKAGGERFVLLGEMLDGDPATLSKVQREGRFSAMFDFPLYFALVDVFCRDRPPSRLGAVLSLDRFYDDPSSLVTLADNHDLPRIASDCGGDEERVAQALTVQLTARGTPSLTYGTEVGLRGAKEPENRPDMRFQPTALTEHVRKLLRLRRSQRALRSGAPVLLDSTDAFFAYARVSPDEAVVVAVNRGQRPVVLSPPAWVTGRAHDLLGGEKARSLEVPPRQVRVWSVSGDFGAVAAEAEAQWRKGAKKRAVEWLANGPGEVYVVGSAPELGAWRVERAVGPGEKARALLPVGAVFEYKLVLRDTGGRTIWESGENRSLFVRDGEGPLRVEAVWRGS